MLNIEQYVYSNKLRNLHPLEKMLFSLATMVIALAAKQFSVSLAVLLLMLALLRWKAGIPGRVLIKLLAVPEGFLLIGAATIAVTISAEPVGMVGAVRIGPYYLGCTANTLSLAWQTVFTSLSAFACLCFLALTTPMTEIIYALRLLRLPPVLLELMTLIYRFIFVFLETAWQIYTAQSSRWGYSSFGRSIHSLALLVGNVWARAYFRTQALYTGLTARGYEQEL